MGYQHRRDSEVAPTGFEPGQVVYEAITLDGIFRILPRRFVRETTHRVFLEVIGADGRVFGGGGRLKPVVLFDSPGSARESAIRSVDSEIARLDQAREAKLRHRLSLIGDEGDAAVEGAREMARRYQEPTDGQQ